MEFEVEVTLRLTVSQSVVSQSVSMSWYRTPLWDLRRDYCIFPVGMLLSEICGLVSMGRPL
jgi:hypothetical protein